MRKRPGLTESRCLLLVLACKVSFGGIVTDISGGAATSSQANTVSVNFGVPTAVKPALGFLLGFDAATNGSIGPDPSSNLILPLAPQYWRGDPHIAYYQRIRSFAPGIPVDLVMSNAWGYPLNNWNNNGPPWQNPTAYQSSLQTLLASYVPLPANVIFEPWNEPNDGWAASTCGCGYQRYWSGTAQQFYQTYLSAFQTIRSSLGPNAQIAGPSFFDYDHQGIRDFLEFCLANGCEVNSLTWHELNDESSVANLPG